MSISDLTDKNIEQMGVLFPNVISEVEDDNERYRFAAFFDPKVRGEIAPDKVSFFFSCVIIG